MSKFEEKNIREVAKTIDIKPVIATPQTNFTQPPVWWKALLSVEATNSTLSTTSPDRTILSRPTEKINYLAPI